MKNISTAQPRALAENVRNVSSTAIDTVQDAAIKAREYAVQHKAITVAGAVAIAALAFGAYALMRKPSDDEKS